MSKERNEETMVEASIRMAGAVESALLASGARSGMLRVFYSELTDNQLFGFHTALLGYVEDLQQEWVRREMLKARTND